MEILRSGKKLYQQQGKHEMQGGRRMADFKGIDLTGNTYGRLTVIKYSGYSLTPKGVKRPKWE